MTRYAHVQRHTCVGRHTWDRIDKPHKVIFTWWCVKRSVVSLSNLLSSTLFHPIKKNSDPLILFPNLLTAHNLLIRYDIVWKITSGKHVTQTCKKDVIRFFKKSLEIVILTRIWGLLCARHCSWDFLIINSIPSTTPWNIRFNHMTLTIFNIFLWKTAISYGWNHDNSIFFFLTIPFYTQ